jgi:prephenate dehydrogenase
MKEIGLIGFGNFGALIYSFLRKYFKIHVYDINQKNKNIDFSNLEDCISKEIIIIALPVQYLKDFLIKIKNKINKNALVIDVSSVKVKPIKIIKELLPTSCNILGTHPLFGAESIKNKINELKIVLTPVRLDNLENIINFLTKKLKLKVIIKTPLEHDKEMAFVQGLAHFIGKTLNEIGLNDSELKTLSYEYLYKMMQIIKNDSEDVFYTIENENAFVKEYRDKFIEKLKEINDKLD